MYPLRRFLHCPVYPGLGVSEGSMPILRSEIRDSVVPCTKYSEKRKFRVQSVLSTRNLLTLFLIVGQHRNRKI